MLNEDVSMNGIISLLLRLCFCGEKGTELDIFVNMFNIVDNMGTLTLASWTLPSIRQMHNELNDGNELT